MEPIENRALVRSETNARSIAPALLHLPSEADSQPFNWEQAVRVLRKNRRFALLFAAGLTLLVAIVAFLLRNVYQPMARLEIDPTSNGIRTLHEIESGTETETPDYLETQSQILQSDSLAIGVIRKLHLDRDPELVSKSDIARYEATRSDAAANPAASPESAYLQEAYTLADRTPLESAALIKFRKRLSVNTVRNSRLIEIGYSSHDPKTAQAVTNALVTEFIDRSYRTRYLTTMEASEWLSGRLDGLRQKMEEATQATETYQKKFGLVEADDKDVPLGQLMNEVNHQFSEAQASRIETEAYLKMINTGQSDSVPAVRDDQLYQALMTKYVDARAQLAQARTIYGDENSNVKKLNDESNELAAQVEAERKRMIEQVRTSYAAAVNREDLMDHSRQKLLAQVGDANSHMVAYHILKNEALASADLYNTLQARLKEAGIYAGLRSSNIHVVDLAPELVKPTGPRRDLIITIGALISCILGLALAFVREGFDNTVRTPDDVRNWVGLPSLGMLPRIAALKSAQAKGNLFQASSSNGSAFVSGVHSTPQIISARSSTAQGEAISNLRAALTIAGPSRPHRIFLISSPSAGEGKSTVAANLAIAFSQRGPTCLLDGDLRHPALRSVFGIKPGPGLSDVLAGKANLDQAMATAPDFPSLKVISGGPVPFSSADLISSERMEAVLITLKQQFEFVIVDSAPLIPFSDARSLATSSDVVILVGRYGLTTRRALTRSAQLLRDMQAPVLGVVLNDIDLDSPDYHYYNYGFSKAYGEGHYRSQTSGTPPPPADRPAAQSAHA